MPRFSAKPSIVIRRPEIASSRLRASTSRVTLWIRFSSLKKLALELVLEGQRLEGARAGAGGGAAPRRAPCGRGGGRRSRRWRRSRPVAPVRAGRAGRSRPPAGRGGAGASRACSARSSFSSTERKSTFGLRRGVVQLDEQRRDVLVGGHGLAEPAEARVQRRELDLRLRELDLLLLGLVERLLGGGDVLVELARPRSRFGDRARNQKAASRPTTATTDQDVAVTLRSLCHLRAGRRAARCAGAAERRAARAPRPVRRVAPRGPRDAGGGGRGRAPSARRRTRPACRTW